MRVKEMMRTDVLTVGPKTDIVSIICLLVQTPLRLVYVVDEQRRLLGVISSVDLLKQIEPSYLDSNLAAALPDDWEPSNHFLEEKKNVTATEIMRTEFVPLKPDSTFPRADCLLREKGINTLPVVDDSGRLLGEIGRWHALRHLVRVFNLCGEA